MAFNEPLNWYGWHSPFGGYSIVSLEYACALERAIGKVSIPWERPTPAGNKAEWEAMTVEQRTLFSKPVTPSRIGIIKVTPPWFSYNKSQFRIGYTMVENTRMSQRWADYCNEMDAIFVPSQFLVNVFRESGVKKPIYVVKQGIDPKKYPYIKRPKKDKFVFSTCGVLDERKNWKDLARAFASEFAPDEPVELWLKNSNPKFGNFEFKDTRIKLIDTYYNFDELLKFYALTDCFVFPSHAEGSGLPPREAMATGLPVILTNWSGLSEVCDPKYNYPLTPTAIDYPEEDYRRGDQPGFQARIDIQEIMYLMRHVYEHREEASLKGKLASEYMHREWNWDECAKGILSILDKL